jgi:hypothetical protein
MAACGRGAEGLVEPDAGADSLAALAEELQWPGLGNTIVSGQVIFASELSV